MRAAIQNALGAVLLACCANAAAEADIIQAAPDHYTLKQTGHSPHAPEAVWEKLTHPETWWHPDHTYSGDAANLSLTVEAGGLWREDWDGGSVLHGSILLLQKDKLLRLDAPFGPLQSLGVHVVWTITLEASPEGGTNITFDEIANGTATSGLDTLAPAVDFVKSEAMRRLTDTGIALP